MLRCETCEQPIEEERIIARLDLDGQLPTKCFSCADSSKSEIFGLMVMSGEHGSRKVGAELVMLSSTNNPDFKEQKRQAIRVIKRRR